MRYKFRFISGKEYEFDSDFTPKEMFLSEWLRFDNGKWINTSIIEEIEQLDYSKKKRSLV